MAFNQRRDAREACVQFLMHCETNGKVAPEQVTADDESSFWEMRPAMRKVRGLTMDLAKGVLGHRGELDGMIQRHCHHYQIHRLNAVDRNVLRLAVYEMFHRLDVPPVVALHEAIEIAKRYGTEESGHFVNGVLDHVKNDVPRPWRTAVEPGPDAVAPAPAAAHPPKPDTLDVNELF